MKKKEEKRSLKKGSITLLLLCMSVVILAACGGTSKNTESAAEMVMEEAAAYDAAAAEAEAGMEISVNSKASATDSSQSQAVNTQRKLIRTVDMDVETENYDQLMAGLEEQVSLLGGYIEYREAYHGSQYSSGSRNAHLQIRIPADRLGEFTAKVKEDGNVTRENESVEDVTLTYVDLESHKKMLTTEQQRLMELLEKAETIEDIIALESRLSEVRYQMESMEAQLRTYDNLVDYSTINLYIEEVERYTPEPKKGAWERIQTGFSDNVYKVGNGLKNFCIEFIIALPILAVWAVVILLLVLVVRFFLQWERKRNSRERDKEAKKERKGKIPLIYQSAMSEGEKEKKNDQNQEP